MASCVASSPVLSRSFEKQYKRPGPRLLLLSWQARRKGKSKETDRRRTEVNRAPTTS